MDETRVASAKRSLPLILLAAVVQGWALYGLHHSIDAHRWPAIDKAWLIALYALASYVPLTVQVLAEHARERMCWILIGIVAVAFFYFGWHHGGWIAEGTDSMGDAEGFFPLGLVSVVLWVHLMPFLQARLRAGQWRVPYSMLFSIAWRNGLLIAEALLFTGLLWLLLLLWATLFSMLDVKFFRELFSKPIFIYPVTSLVFGFALHLIGSVERITSLILEQILNVLKWLAVLAGIILTLFTVALVFKLRVLVFTGNHAIGAAWLLWLVAVIVLLLNAAFRDGSVQRPYPLWIAQGLRFATPLAVIVALTAFYSLVVRARHYGLTVERVWAFVVGAEAVIYSVGYTWAAFQKGPWLAGISRVNVAVALFLIATIALTLTPVLSPYRLSADSQFRHARNYSEPAADDKGWGTPLHYLRFEAGRYGRERLEQLAKIEDVPQAERIRKLARAMLAQKDRWVARPEVTAEDLVARITVYPAGRALDTQLSAQLIKDLNASASRLTYMRTPNAEIAGIFADLDGDGRDEFLLAVPFSGVAYASNEAGQWEIVGDLHFSAKCAWPTVLQDLKDGKISVQASRWKDLVVGGERFRVDP